MWLTPQLWLTLDFLNPCSNVSTIFFYVFGILLVYWCPPSLTVKAPSKFQKWHRMFPQKTFMNNDRRRFSFSSHMVRHFAKYIKYISRVHDSLIVFWNRKRKRRENSASKVLPLSAQILKKFSFVLMKILSSSLAWLTVEGVLSQHIRKFYKR